MVVTTRAAARDLAPEAVVGLSRSFPLIARPGPVCLALEERVTQLSEVLDVPFGDAGATFAAHALTRAAGLASECQRPKEVNRILRQHLAVYAGRDLLSGAAALAMLEPATDLARLHALAGHTDRAVTWLTRLMHAVRTGTSISIDRYDLPLDHVDADPGEHELLQGWAWGRLLADAVKILTMAGQRAEAAALVTRHGGLGARLTETRQAMVVAHLVAGEPVAARHYLAGAQPSLPWESEIASCLAVLAAEPADRPADTAALISTFQHSAPATDLAAYRARYGVMVTRLAHATGHPYASIARQVAAEAIAVGDGHAAREVVRTVAGCLSHKDIATLERNIIRAGLRSGALTGYNLSRLRTTADHATTILQESLQAIPR
ncbi:hypothetical protein APR04_001684 [Promicromonospora umidemergens]|uniref:Transcriptional regulator n=1 Tax=Promicromonospora umidemergens TaxID=629679 RepID=A0ABP8XFY8_9MICO|nr:hypothetical protein [Promicromonospora umidemergens]MCP2282781.1 hypothetical protein [Promicromonospora umidemergens]